jgi:hypothetical protein
MDITRSFNQNRELCLRSLVLNEVNMSLFFANWTHLYLYVIVPGKIVCDMYGCELVRSVNILHLVIPTTVRNMTIMLSIANRCMKLTTNGDPPDCRPALIPKLTIAALTQETPLIKLFSLSVTANSYRSYGQCHR